MGALFLIDPDIDNSGKTRSLLDIEKHYLIIAVLLMFFLISYLIFNAYNDVKKTYVDAVDIISTQQHKRQLLSNMHNAVRERSYLILQMSTVEDFFELDEMNQQLYKWAAEYIRNREQLLLLPLNTIEIELIEAQQKEAVRTAPILHEVADLIIDDKRDEAYSLLFDEAMPGQNRVLEQINLSIKEYNNKTTSFVEKLKKDSAQSGDTFLLLGSLIAVISFIVIAVIMTRVSRMEQEKLKQALANLAEQKYALDQHAIVSITDTDGIITYVNDKFCQSSGYSEEEMLGKNHSILKSGLHDELFYKDMYRKISRGEVWHGEICNHNKDRYEYWLDTTIVPFMGDSAEPQSYIAMSTDITARKHTEEELRHSQKMDALEKLTGGIAHDHNNMLGIIMGYTEFLKKELSGQPKLEKYLQHIMHAAERSTTLTRQLLDFSRYKSTTTHVADVNSILMDNQFMLEKMLTVRVNLVFDLTEEPCPVLLDSHDLEDAIINISINAMHAMESEGRLTFKTMRISGDAPDFLNQNLQAIEYVVLRITDTGSGMDAKTLERVFDPFYTTKGDKGLGLGLSQVYGFIDRSGGVIKAASTPGEGTVFSLYFPLYQEEAIEPGIHEA